MIYDTRPRGTLGTELFSCTNNKVGEAWNDTHCCVGNFQVEHSNLPPGADSIGKGLRLRKVKNLLLNEKPHFGLTGREFWVGTDLRTGPPGWFTRYQF